MHNSVISPAVLSILLPYPTYFQDHSTGRGWGMTLEMEEPNGWAHFSVPPESKQGHTLVCFIYSPVACFSVWLVAFTPFPVLSQPWSKAISMLKGRGREAVGAEWPCNTPQLISSDIYLRSWEEMEQLIHEDECHTRALPSSILPRDLRREIWC